MPASSSSSLSRSAATAASSAAGARPREPARRPPDEWFHALACAVAQKLGSHWAFFSALLLIVAWALTGPLFHFNDAWQLVINTGTTIITFLMVFLIQSTQNRDSRALHLKLDELIRASRARNVFADLEDASEQELDAFQREFKELRRRGLSGIDAAQRAREQTQQRRDKRG